MSDLGDQIPDTAARLTTPDGQLLTTPLAEHVLLTFGAATHIGKVRPRNEDHFAVVRRKRSREVLASNVALPSDLPDDEAYSFIVADGVGGEGFGDLASQLAVRAGWDSASHAASWLMKLDNSTREEIRQQVAAVAQAIQQAFLAYCRDNPKFAGMATTWTCAYITGWHAFIAHVGDSRAYHCRGGQALQVTLDHTLAEELRRSGADPDHLRKFRSVLTRAFGGDCAEVVPDVHQLQLADGDAILLCSDGLSNLVTDPEIASLVCGGRDPQAICDELIELALSRGAPDNVTAVLARVAARR
ncbi:MAG: PP2C family protein-serine/threonine phosphatase [Pirellulaceae bacterium]